MNLSFSRDVRNKNRTTFDQLVEIITEEITNENMNLHRNHGGVAPNQAPRMNYNRGQGRQLPQPHQRQRDYPSDPNSRISYVAFVQEGLLHPYPVQGALGPLIGGYNYGVAAPTYYEAATSALPILLPRQETPRNYCRVYRSYGYSTEECLEVENLANKREANLGPRREANTRRRGQSLMRGRRPPSLDRRSQQWDRGPSNQELQQRNSRSSARHPRVEEVPEHRLIKCPEKAPIWEINTIYGGPYIGGQTQNAHKCYAKEAERALMTNWLINSRPSGSNKVDPITFA
ncbi:hypothetical protein Adt_23522 [Abeliophyllum distichum]|uniref:Uncharacterized protein n=1 Tax=Abeliophyllum distichum TaxID=126358 RepID=A0ABD1SB42_9LAMI